MLDERVTQVNGRGQVTHHRGRALGLRAGPAHQREHVVPAPGQLAAGRAADEPAGTRDEDSHGANDTLAPWIYR